jgi:hypothetical protein
VATSTSSCSHGHATTAAKSTAKHTSIVGHSIQQSTDSLLDGCNLLGRALDLQYPPNLVDVHLGTRAPLHGDDGSTAPPDDDAHVVAQLHLVMQDLRGFLVGLGIVLQAGRAARPVAAPELGLPIVGARGQYVSGGMPLHVPDGHIVGVGDAGRRLFRSLRPDVPVQEGSVHSTGGKYRLIQRMPSDAGHLLVMALERAQFPHGPNIVHLNELVSAGGQEPVAIVVPCHLGDGVLVSVEGAQVGSAPRIPKLDEIVFRSGTNDRRPWMPRHGLHVPAMPLQNPLLGPGGPIPNADGGVVTTRRELGVSWTECQTMDRLPVVRVEGLDGSDAGTPVLDVAAGVAGEEVVVVVRPRHAPEGVVVGRHDELEGEVDAIPQRELALLVAREEAPAARRPREGHDRLRILGPRHVGHVRQVRHAVAGRRCVHDGQAEVGQVRRVRLEEGRVPHVRRAARLSVQPRLQIEDSRRVVVDALALQIALLGLGRLLAVVVVPLAAGTAWSGHAAVFFVLDLPASKLLREMVWYSVRWY